jgi:hypothetical protein
MHIDHGPAVLYNTIKTLKCPSADATMQRRQTQQAHILNAPLSISVPISQIKKKENMPSLAVTDILSFRVFTTA